MYIWILFTSLFWNIEYAYIYNDWIVGTSTLPRATYRMAAGYDDINDTIWLLGGWDNNTYGQLVGYKPGSDYFIDVGSHVFTRIIDGQQYYTQLDSYLYLYSDFDSSVHKFYLTNQTMQYDYYSSPVVAITACLCSLDLDDGYLIISGGHNGEDSLVTVQVLNMSSNEWNIIWFDTPRSYHACISFNNAKIFVIGGVNMQNGILSTVEVFDFYDAVWSYTTGTLSEGLFGSRSVVYKNEIVVIGGENYSGKLDTINVINGVTNEIYPTTFHIDTAISDFAAINVGDIIYAFGGFATIPSWRYIESYISLSPSTSHDTPVPVAAPSNAPSNAESLPTDATHNTSSSTNLSLIQGFLIKDIHD